jgi:hypothetical protein
MEKKVSNLFWRKEKQTLLGINFLKRVIRKLNFKGKIL